MAVIRVVCFVLFVGLAAACQPRCPKCPPMWTFYKGNCYRLFGAGKPYAEAEKHCQEFSQVGQGHVASVASTEENDLLFAMFTSASGRNNGLWIGFTDVAEEGNFVWADGSAVSYTDWNTGEPNNAKGNEHCTLLRTVGNWNDSNCNRALAYVCKMTTTK